MQVHQADGQLLANPLQIDTPRLNDTPFQGPDFPKFPSITTLPNDKFLLSWVSDSDHFAGSAIYARLYEEVQLESEDGDSTRFVYTKVGEDIVVSADAELLSYKGNVTAQPSGEFTISWEENGDLFFQQFDANRNKIYPFEVTLEGTNQDDRLEADETLHFIRGALGEDTVVVLTLKKSPTGSPS